MMLKEAKKHNFGEGFENICEALKKLTATFSDINIIYSVHLNPNVQKIVMRKLGNIKNIFLVAPLDYHSFVYLMNKSSIILTDSGGIQEEAPSLGKPVLVMRNKTERPEAVEAGTVKTVGTDTNNIYNETFLLLTNQEEYHKMSYAHNPFSDGHASQRIVDKILSQ